ncbi:MAG TPA: hypothetical protein VJV77_10255 [Casimicrobiaceae bacterium]|nr:hypothetical protein [Casimicrobiaceae bacterium]
MASNPPQALRVTFGYQGSQVRVLGSERVAMLVPAPAGDPPAAGETGYWLAVRDAAGGVVYHQPLQDPLQTSVEVFAPEQHLPITRIPNAVREGRFTVIVPDSADAELVELYGPPDPARPDQPSQALVRADFDRLRRMKPP